MLQRSLASEGEMHEFKISSSMHRCTQQRARTKIRSDRFLWPNIHTVFVYVLGAKDHSYPKQIPTHTKTDSRWAWAHTFIYCRANVKTVVKIEAFGIFVKTVKYEKLISEEPHVITLEI